MTAPTIWVTMFADWLSVTFANTQAQILADPTAAMVQIFILTTGLGGQYFIAHRNTKGFWLWIASNFGLIWVAIDKLLPGMLVLYLVYTGMCIYSIRKWREA